MNQILEEQEGKEDVLMFTVHCIICQSSALKKKKSNASDLGQILHHLTFILRLGSAFQQFGLTG